MKVIKILIMGVVAMSVASCNNSRIQGAGVPTDTVPLSGSQVEPVQSTQPVTKPDQTALTPEDYDKIKQSIHDAKLIKAETDASDSILLEKPKQTKMSKAVRDVLNSIPNKSSSEIMDSILNN